MSSFSLEEAVTHLTQEGSRFALTKAMVNGSSLPVFANAPHSLTDLLQQSTAEFADRELLVFEDERLHYREFSERVARFAQVLREDFGICRGDRVAIAMRNYPEYVITLLAAASLGAVAVHMNAWWTKLIKNLFQISIRLIYQRLQNL